MRKLRNILYITEPNARLSKNGEAITIFQDNEELGTIPLINLEGIVCFSFLGMSPALMEACWNNNISVSFVSPYGKYLASLSGKVSGNVLLRKKQFEIYDDETISTSIAKNCILGKLMNSRAVLQRFCRDYPNNITSKFTEKLEYLSKGIQELKETKLTLDELRGVEGILSKTYFNCFDDLILSKESGFVFDERTRRPPLNPVNALLSFAYTLISLDCKAALETVGLDPQVGFLHRLRPGRQSLALDLMEEFRPYLGDRFVLNLINNRIISLSDFVIRENGAVFLNDNGRKNVLNHWQKRKSDVILHPFLDEKIEIGLLPYSQALLLARFIRGDIDSYPPFLIK